MSTSAATHSSPMKKKGISFSVEAPAAPSTPTQARQAIEGRLKTPKRKAEPSVTDIERRLNAAEQRRAEFLEERVSKQLKGAEARANVTNVVAKQQQAEGADAAALKNKLAAAEQRRAEILEERVALAKQMEGADVRAKAAEKSAVDAAALAALAASIESKLAAAEHRRTAHLEERVTKQQEQRPAKPDVGRALQEKLAAAQLRRNDLLMDRANAQRERHFNHDAHVAAMETLSCAITQATEAQLGLQQAVASGNRNELQQRKREQLQAHAAHVDAIKEAKRASDAGPGAAMMEEDIACVLQSADAKRQAMRRQEQERLGARNARIGEVAATQRLRAVQKTMVKHTVMRESFATAAAQRETLTERKRDTAKRQSDRVLQVRTKAEENKKAMSAKIAGKQLHAEQKRSAVLSERGQRHQRRNGHRLENGETAM